MESADTQHCQQIYRTNAIMQLTELEEDEQQLQCDWYVSMSV